MKTTILEADYYSNEGKKNAFVAEYISVDICRWINENITGDWEIRSMPNIINKKSVKHDLDYVFALIFHDEEDAMAFKLRFI